MDIGNFHYDQKNKDFTYTQILAEYMYYLSYRDKFIKWGLITLCTLPFIFMVLMFFLASKVLFLALWVISFILIAVALAYVDYKGYYYRHLLHLENDVKLSAEPYSPLQTYIAQIKEQESKLKTEEETIE